MFPITNWTHIEAARHDTAARRDTLGELAYAYRRPLEVVARKRGLSPQQAEDVVQELFVKLVERDVVRELDRARGRLRAFLRTSLEHAIANHIARAHAQKRGGTALPATFVDDVAAPAPGADEAFDRAWRAALLARAFARLAAEHRTGPFDVIVEYFRGDTPSLAELAASHGTTVAQLKSMLHRARRRFRALVHAEVAATVGSQSEVEAEVRALAL